MKRIFIGYLLSLIVAATFLTVILYQITTAFAEFHDRFLDVFYVWGLLGFWTLVVTIIPSALLIYFAERKSWRSVLLYICAGGLFSLLVGRIFEMPVLLECAATGAIAGLAYWAIAGRKAGLQQQQEA
jgi:hypothetical protein